MVPGFINGQKDHVKHGRYNVVHRRVQWAYDLSAYKSHADHLQKVSDQKAFLFEYCQECQFFHPSNL